MAIVAHYVTNEGEGGMFILLLLVVSFLRFNAEELLIDFQELIGPHTGENMATVVWSTLEMFGIEAKVCL